MVDTLGGSGKRRMWGRRGTRKLWNHRSKVGVVQYLVLSAPEGFYEDGGPVDAGQVGVSPGGGH
jgi:hypothetical protein